MATSIERPRGRRLVFRVFYSSSYTIVFLVIAALVLVTPADAVYQAYRESRWIDIIIIGGGYVLTALIAILIYASRLYTNRVVLNSIPKTYIPIEKEDLPAKKVRNMIVDGLTSSAVIAYQARPKPQKRDVVSPTASGRISRLTSSSDPKRGGQKRTWGKIKHPGWSGPDSTDLPDLQYATVIAELGDLIEAKAVSLAPTDPCMTPSPDGLPMADVRVVEMLQRPAEMGLRQYVDRLMELGMIQDRLLAADFLALYERARFHADPPTETEFRNLMGVFAEILRGMTGTAPDILEQLDAGADEEEERFDHLTATDGRSAISTFSETGSVLQPEFVPPTRISEDSARSMDSDEYDQQSLRTAPTARSVSRPIAPIRTPSGASGLGIRPTRSTSSELSQGSASTGGSVIRLAGAGVDPPYTIQVPGLTREA